MQSIYSARCLDCAPELRELTMLDGTLDFNTKLAQNHNESKGHITQLLEAPAPIFVNGQKINTSYTNSRRVIKTFMS